MNRTAGKTFSDLLSYTSLIRNTESVGRRDDSSNTVDSFRSVADSVGTSSGIVCIALSQIGNCIIPFGEMPKSAFREFRHSTS
jgi:hypothetical protein